MLCQCFVWIIRRIVETLGQNLYHPNWRYFRFDEVQYEYLLSGSIPSNSFRLVFLCGYGARWKTSRYLQKYYEKYVNILCFDIGNPMIYRLSSQMNNNIKNTYRFFIIKTSLSRIVLIWFVLGLSDVLDYFELCSILSNILLHHSPWFLIYLKIFTFK